ncbi:histone-like nucleoid-structuring protein H-NS [Jannaschia sp. AI_61]|nr:MULTISPECIES: H-NS histone family protein [unclassified Jannaschia]GIT90175.1 histone-like nucleoid-structuring protein H-NS [Jannaschia sp. AI_61]
MSIIDLNMLSLAELKTLEKDVAKAITDFETRKRQAALTALNAAAKKAGFTLAELVTAGKADKKSALTPKYRHPENSELAWSGRVRKPAWFKAAMEGGTAESDLLIGRERPS